MGSLDEKRVQDEESSDSDDADYQPPPEEKPVKAASSRKRRAPPLPTSKFIDDEEDDEKDEDDSRIHDQTDEIQELNTASNSSPKRARVEGNESANQGNESLETPAKETTNIDKIWAEMNAGVRVSSSASKPRDECADLSSWLARPNPEPKKAFTIPTLADLEKTEAKQDAEQKERQLRQTTAGRNHATGLEDVLNLVRDANTGTVLDGSRQSWQTFKRDDDVRDELDVYKKDKGRYTDKVAFLERTDVREWKFEQSGRKSRR